MWRLLRYVLALAVGVGVSVAVASVSGQHMLVTVTLTPLYAVTASLSVVATRRVQRDGGVAGGTQSDRTTVTAVGAVGGGVGTALLIVSVPVGVAAYGLLLLGTVSTVVQMSATPES